MNEEQGPSESDRIHKQYDEEGVDGRPEEPMEQDPDQAGRDGDNAPTAGLSSLDFNFLGDYEIGAET